jgi:ABC-type nitrate/sulfonate/bicarbonate transport system substrate-binding protein
MLLYKLAQDGQVKFASVPIIDTTLNDGLLAAENGSLDATAAGLTQRTEALKRKGRVVTTMDAVNLVDIAGFVCKESVYKKHKKDIESMVKIWCDCANYVLSDPDHHSAPALDYLKANASTHYTIDEFKRALSYEYFPRNIADAQREIVSKDGKYSFERASRLCSDYLFDTGATKTKVPMPHLIPLDDPNED